MKKEDYKVNTAKVLYVNDSAQLLDSIEQNVTLLYCLLYNKQTAESDGN